MLSQIFQDSVLLESTFPESIPYAAIRGREMPVIGPVFHALCRISSSEVQV